MLSYLISSEVRLKLLEWFINNPNQEFFVQEIIRATGTNLRNSFEELKKMESEGLLISRKQAREKYYKLNLKNQFVSSLTELFKIENESKNNQKKTITELLKYQNGFPQMLEPAASCKPINTILARYGVKNKITTLIHWYEADIYSVWVDPAEFELVGKEVGKKFLEDAKFAPKVLKDYEIAKKSYLDFCENLSSFDLDNLDKKELKRIYTDYYTLLQSFSLFQWLTIYSYLHNNIENYFENSLIDNIRLEKPDLSLAEARMSLIKCRFEAQDQEFIQNEKVKFVELVRLSSRNQDLKNKNILEIIDIFKSDARLWNLLEDYVKDFGWLYYGYKGPEIEIQKLISVIVSGVNWLEKSEQKIDRTIESKVSEISKYSDSLQEKIRLNNTLLEAFASSEDSFYIGQVASSRLLNAIGQRYFLSLEQIRYLYTEEIVELLKTDKVDTAQIQARIKEHLHFSDTQKDEYLIDLTVETKLNNFKIIENFKKKMFRGSTFCSSLKFGKISFVDSKNFDPKAEILVLEKADFSFLFSLKILQIQAILTTENDISSDIIAFCKIYDIALIQGMEKEILNLKAGQNVLVNSRHGEIWVV